jgi:hypothetical protein
LRASAWQPINCALYPRVCQAGGGQIGGGQGKRNKREK